MTPEEPSAVEQLAKLQLKQIKDKEEAQEKGCLGCLGVIAVIVVGTFAASTCSGPPKNSAATVNNVSRFAQRAHLILAADVAASRDVRNEAAAGNYAQAYADADRASTVFHESSSMDGPDGFDRSRDAFNDYSRSLSKSFRKIAEALNEPSLRGEVDIATSVSQLDADMKIAIDAFKSDLAHTSFTHAEKQRLIDRLIHD